MARTPRQMTHLRPENGTRYYTLAEKFPDTLNPGVAQHLEYADYVIANPFDDGMDLGVKELLLQWS
eukprot:12231106-Prorocentrum_lima.AAC.1